MVGGGAAKVWVRGRGLSQYPRPVSVLYRSRCGHSPDSNYPKQGTNVTCLLPFLAVLSLHEFWLLSYIMNIREEKKPGDRVSERGFGFSKEFCQISRGMKPRTQVWVIRVWLWLKGTVIELGSRGWNPISWKRSKDIQRNWEDIEQTGVSLQIRKLLFLF